MISELEMNQHNVAHERLMANVGWLVGVMDG